MGSCVCIIFKGGLKSFRNLLAL